MLLLASTQTSFFSQLESPRWIIVLISFLGVFLAYMSEEGFLLLQGDGSDTWSSQKNQDYKFASQQISQPSYFYLRYLAGLYNGILIFSCTLLGFVTYTIEAIKAKTNFCLCVFHSKRHARSKKHFVYIMLKKSLHLPVSPDETEVDSYLDCKEHIAEKWPFMWEVSNVKSKAIKCQTYDCIPMSSYSYLDLLRDERVQNAAIAAAQQWSSGNHGPRLLGGNTTIIRQLEKSLADFFGREDSLLCTTGYLACMSATALACGENSVVFADNFIHASLRAGLKLGEGVTVFFKHNDMKECEKCIKRHRHKYLNAWIVVESVYSMDGDIANLKELYRLSQQYNIKLMVDEAHGLGVLGKTGRGLEEYFNLPGVVSLIVGTFSKSVASIGGFIVGPKRDINYIADQALGSLFSAPLPGYCAGAALKSLEVIKKEPHTVAKAQRNSRLLRKLLQSNEYWPENYPESSKFCLKGSDDSTVIPVIFPHDLNRVLHVATAMKEKGYMCSAVGYPACPMSSPRFRLTGTSAYDDKLIEHFGASVVYCGHREADARSIV